MPNRIIKETILTSPSINNLSVWGERHFYRCLLLIDDHGCFEATPEVVRGRAYPLLKISGDDVTLWHREVEEKEIIRFWQEDGRIYGVFVNFDRHNPKYSVTDEGKATRHRPKTPPPPKHFKPLFATLCQDLPNPNPNPNPNPKEKNTPYWAAFSPQTQEILKTVSKDFNIYALLGRLKKQSKSKVELPQEVVLRVCQSFLDQKGAVKDQWAWFIATVPRIAQDLEHEGYKSAPMAQSIKDIMRGICFL